MVGIRPEEGVLTLFTTERHFRIKFLIRKDFIEELSCRDAAVGGNLPFVPSLGAPQLLEDCPVPVLLDKLLDVAEFAFLFVLFGRVFVKLVNTQEGLLTMMTLKLHYISIQIFL